ncbi:uncharacterized protein [Maniola hyperantus]|uniref:uncharacterized protein n=1 Tax=Aphantopus hyperantus TaxID=2795564 RepID=UPI00374887E9
MVFVTVYQVVTEDGKMFIRYKGFYYTKLSSSRTRWRCVSTKTCYASIILKHDYSIAKETGSHHHLPKLLLKLKNGRYIFAADWQRYQGNVVENVSSSPLSTAASTITTTVTLIPLSVSPGEDGGAPVLQIARLSSSCVRRDSLFGVEKKIFVIIGINNFTAFKICFVIADAYRPIVREITMNTGKVYKFVNGYTYGGPTKLRASMRYRCTMGCGVYLYLSFDGDVIDPVPIHNHKPANLFLTSSGIYILAFALSQRGARLLLFEGYSYSHQCVKNDFIHWKCTMGLPGTTRRCNARLYTTIDYEVIDLVVHLLPTRKGKHPLLMYNNYTYKKQRVCVTGKVIWYCSNRHSGCKAYVESLNDDYLPGDLEHNHPSPNYCRMKDGRWIKV